MCVFMWVGNINGGGVDSGWVRVRVRVRTRALEIKAVDWSREQRAETDLLEKSVSVAVRL